MTRYESMTGAALTSLLSANKPRLAVRMLLASILICTLVAVGSSTAWADPIRRLGQNPRGLALGGTGMSYANDEMALYYNPAGLGAVDNWWVELLPWALESSEDALDLASSGNLSSFDDPADLISEFLGKEIYLRSFIYPNALFNLQRGLTIGATGFNETAVSMEFHNAATPEIDVDFRSDQGSIVGSAFPINEGKILLGVNLKSIQRSSFAGTISSGDLAAASAGGELDLTDYFDENQGSGSGYDVGMIVRMESFANLRPQWALAVQNLGGIDLGDAGTIEQETSFGFSIQPEITPLVDLLFAVEFRDLLLENADDEARGKRTHIGLEVGVIPYDTSTYLATLRLGSNAGATTYGVEFSLWHSLTLQYVIWSEEYGTASLDDPRTRQLIQFNFIGF